MSQPFPMEQFRDVFKVTSKIKNKLQPFIAKYKEIDMQWIITSFEELYQMLYNEKIDVISIFNSLYGIKNIFEAGEVLLTNLIEIYFLPKIFQIARFEAGQPEQKRGLSYFISMGFPKDTTDIQRYGGSFVKIACEIIQAGAAIKPKKLFENHEINDPSDYSSAFMRLQSEGWKPYEKLNYIKEGTLVLKGTFDKNLKAYENVVDPYIDYYSQIFHSYIHEGKVHKGYLDPKKVLQHGDVFITSAVIGQFEEAMASKSLRVRLHCLRLLNDFMKWADMDAAYQINCSDLMTSTINEIINPNIPTLTLSRGKELFVKLEGNQQIKQEFYIELLKGIQFWALCFPAALKVKNKESRVKFLYDQLSSRLMLQFPEDKNLKQNKAVFDKHFQKKKVRNQTLLSEFQELDPQNKPLPLITAANKGIPPPAQNKPKQSATNKSIPAAQSKPKQSATNKSIPSQSKLKQSATNKSVPSQSKLKQTPKDDYQRVKKQINSVTYAIDSLSESEQKVGAKIQAIQKFNKEFEASMEKVDIQDKALDEVIDLGFSLLERIKKIQSPIDRYQSKQINFQQLTQALPSKPPTSRSNQQIEKEKQPTIPPKSESRLPPMLEEKILPQVQQNKQKFHNTSINQFENRKVQEQTPIKKVQQEYSEAKQKGNQSIPKGSKPSISQIEESSNFESKSKTKKRQTEQFFEQIDIKPASHKNPVNPKIRINQNVFEPERKPQSRLSNEIPHSNPRIQDSLGSNKIKVNNNKQSKQKIQEESPIKVSKYSNRDQKSENILEEDVAINHNIPFPKKNINPAGSYIIKAEEQIRKVEVLPLKSKDTLPIESQKNERSHPSKASSQHGSRVNFQQSKVSNVQLLQEEDDDIIMMPEINPLELSYHEINDNEESSIKAKQISFKKCFQNDKYLLGTDRQFKMFNLANDTLNLIKPSGNMRRASSKKQNSINIPEILNERDRKFKDELKYVQDQKNRKIKELEHKIKHLQNEGNSMKSKLQEQDNELKMIKTYSQVDSSRGKKNQYVEEQDYLYKTKVAARSVRQRSLYSQSRVKQPHILEPQGSLINSRRFGAYFQKFQTQKLKKNLLKNKQLLLKNDNIQIGCMTKREDSNLIITFYITPERDIEGLTFAITPTTNNNLSIRAEPNSIPFIRQRKQQKMVLVVQIKKIPYQLPEIQFVYRLSSDSSINGLINSEKVLIPCAFHKFVPLSFKNQGEFVRMFKNSQNILRGEQVPYSKKNLKNISYLGDFLPGGVVLNNGQTNEKGEISFGGKASWRNEQDFYIRVMIKPNQFLYVQAVGDVQSEVLEFYIALVTNLLMKDIDLRQM